MADWDFIGRGTDLLGGIGSGIGAWLGGQAGENDRDDAAATLRAITSLYRELNPSVQAGYEDAVTLGPSAMEGVASSLDPTMRSTQLQALRALMSAGTSGGMDEGSRAALMQANANAAREQRAAQGALRSDFAQRGVSGGGAELALRSAAGQQSANANAMAGVQAAADARMRALASLQAGAGLAGQVRGADYGQAADVAGARDRVAEANARNLQAVRGRNIDRRYAADQQTYDNRFRRAQGIAGGLGAQADMSLSNADRKERRGYAIGGSIGSGVGAAAGYGFGR